VPQNASWILRNLWLIPALPMLAAGVSVIGLIAWTVALPKIAPIRWDNADEGGARPTGSAATLP